MARKTRFHGQFASGSGSRKQEVKIKAMYDMVCELTATGKDRDKEIANLKEGLAAANQTIADLHSMLSQADVKKAKLVAKKEALKYAQKEINRFLSSDPIPGERMSFEIRVIKKFLKLKNERELAKSVTEEKLKDRHYRERLRNSIDMILEEPGLKHFLSHI